MTNIKISNSSLKDLESFTSSAWHEADIEHYGESVNWEIEEFTFKATVDDKVVGYITGKFEAGVTFVDNLLVDKAFRGEGIGKLLMGKVENLTKELGGHKIYLYTMKEWEASKVYEKLGFKLAGTLQKHYLKRDFVIYEKLL